MILGFEKRKRPKGVTIIAVWMILLVLPGLYRAFDIGLGVVISPLATIEWTYYMCAFVCAIGLLRLKDWARKWTIGLFFIQFLATLIAMNYLKGPSWDLIVEWQSNNYNISPDLLKGILIAVIVVYIVWQIIVILYLTHPKIKAFFSN